VQVGEEAWPDAAHQSLVLLTGHEVKAIRSVLISNKNNKHQVGVEAWPKHSCESVYKSPSRFRKRSEFTSAELSAPSRGKWSTDFQQRSRWY
jgi:hypothetical protein